MTQVAAFWFIWSLVVYFTTSIQAYPAASLPCDDNHINLLLPETISEPLVDHVTEIQSIVPIPIVPDLIPLDREIITNEVFEAPELSSIILPEHVSVINEEKYPGLLVVDDTALGYKPDLVISEIKPLDIELPMESVLMGKDTDVKIPCEDEITAIDLPIQYQDEPKLQLYPDTILVDPVFQQTTPIKVINSIDAIELPEDPTVVISENPAVIIDDNNVQPIIFHTPEEKIFPCEQNSDIEVDFAAIPPAPELPELIVPEIPVVYNNDNPLRIPDVEYIGTSITNEEVTKEVMESFIMGNLPYILAHRMPTFGNSFETVVVNVIKSFVLPSTQPSNIAELPPFNSLGMFSSAPSLNYAPCSTDLPHYHEQQVALPHFIN